MGHCNKRQGHNWRKNVMTTEAEKENLEDASLIPLEIKEGTTNQRRQADSRS